VTTVLKIGITLILASFGMWLYEHEFDNVLPISPDLDVWVGALGLLLLVIFLVIFFGASMLGMSMKWSKKGRCVRCGVKIPKTEMYCEFHKKEVANEYLNSRGENN